MKTINETININFKAYNYFVTTLMLFQKHLKTLVVTHPAIP